MNRRPRLLLASIVFVLLAGVVLGGPAVAAAAPKNQIKIITHHKGDDATPVAASPELIVAR